MTGVLNYLGVLNEKWEFGRALRSTYFQKAGSKVTSEEKGGLLPVMSRKFSLSSKFEVRIAPRTQILDVFFS